jgi:predicted GNAT family N-acyltransferase
MSDFIIKQTNFNTDADAIKHIREQVFIEEQHVPVELEWDGLDDEAIQILVTDNDQPIATSRMLSDGHIGRMAVMTAYRNQGIGSQMLIRLIKIARQNGLDKVFLSAQVEAIDFYLKHSFTVNSETYMDAGIPHKDMILNLRE